MPDPARTFPPPPQQTANPAPVRRPGSIRRTTSIDVGWPEGNTALRVLHGRGRDLLTRHDGAPDEIVATASLTLAMDAARTIVALTTEPAEPGLAGLVGRSSGKGYRKGLAEAAPGLAERGDPLFLLLDDVPGVNIIAPWGWALQKEDRAAMLRDPVRAEKFRQSLGNRLDFCWGLQEGFTGLDIANYAWTDPGKSVDGGELRHPVDPDGWHAFPAVAGPSVRRARRIEIWRDGEGTLGIDAGFQDSAPRLDGTRAAMHEYVMRARVSAGDLELLALELEPRVLPFPECPGAVANAMKLVGTRLADLRRMVPEILRGAAGCTHLNDALRALADVPPLAARLSASA